MLQKLFRGEEGQGMVEYGLIIALVAIVVIVVLTAMGGSLKTTFTNIGGKLDTANQAAP